MTTPRLLLVATVGLALLIGAPLVWLADRGPDQVGDPVLADTSTPSPTSARATPPTARATPPAARTTPPAARAPSPSPTAAPTEPSDPLAAVRPQASPRPLLVRIPAIGVDAALVEVGTGDDGGMEIPADVATAGWYRWGPRPGEPGSAVIAGHVDSRTQGRGAFFDLRRLSPGDLVEVDYDDGSSTTFEVTGRDVVAKAVVPVDELFSRDGPARLTLVTCGGDFDRASGHYRDNVVVVAVPVTTDA
jgi:sortase (surface protein transpeptidase)